MAGPPPLVIALSLYALVLLVGLLWLAAGVGRMVLRRIGVVACSGLEAGLFAIVLGLGMTAYAVLALGLVGLLRAPFIAAALLALAVVAHIDLLTVARAVPTGVRDVRAALAMLWNADRILALAIPIAGVMFAAVALEALAPPFGYDSLMYHLHGARRFLELGRIAPLPDVQQANQPFTVELLYLIGLAFGSAELGGVLHLTCALLCGLAVFAVGRSWLGTRTGAFAAVICLSTTILSVYGPMANIDYGAALFDFLAVAAFGSWLRERRPGWLVVSGMLLGFSLGSKYLGVLTGAALGLGLILTALRSGMGLGRLARLVLLFGVPAALIAAPWYLKSWLWFGTPVWPFLSPGPPDLNVTLAGQVRMARTPLEFLTLPYRLYTEGSLEYPEARLPLLFVLVPLYAVVSKQRR